jgi:hypothetical protein
MFAGNKNNNISNNFFNLQHIFFLGFFIPIPLLLVLRVHRVVANVLVQLLRRDALVGQRGDDELIGEGAGSLAAGRRLC